MNNNECVRFNGKKVNEDERSEIVSSEDYLHPLENFWSLWVFMNEKHKTWEANLVCTASFDTVEDFWRLYHFTKLPLELNEGQDYMIFKDDIKPTWEHPANRKGGRWIINLDKKRDDLNTLWLKVVLLMIGENLVHGEMICGAVVNVRVKSKIGLWLCDASKDKQVREIGRALKEKLGNICKINFHRHNYGMNMYTI